MGATEVINHNFDAIKAAIDAGQPARAVLAEYATADVKASTLETIWRRRRVAKEGEAIRQANKMTYKAAHGGKAPHKVARYDVNAIVAALSDEYRELKASQVDPLNDLFADPAFCQVVRDLISATNIRATAMRLREQGVAIQDKRLRDWFASLPANGKNKMNQHASGSGQQDLDMGEHDPGLVASAGA